MFQVNYTELHDRPEIDQRPTSANSALQFITIPNICIKTKNDRGHQNYSKMLLLDTCPVVPSISDTGRKWSRFFILFSNKSPWIHLPLYYLGGGGRPVNKITQNYFLFTCIINWQVNLVNFYLQMLQVIIHQHIVLLSVELSMRQWLKRYKIFVKYRIYCNWCVYKINAHFYFWKDYVYS